MMQIEGLTYWSTARYQISPFTIVFIHALSPSRDRHGDPLLGIDVHPS